MHAYLRHVVMNRIREELRRHGRRPAQDALESGLEDDAASPLEAAIGQETVDWYESALATLSPEEREAIVARLELGMTHQEIADALGKPSADAARMIVARAMVQLARAMESSPEHPLGGVSVARRSVFARRSFHLPGTGVSTDPLLEIALKLTDGARVDWHAAQGDVLPATARSSTVCVSCPSSRPSMPTPAWPLAPSMSRSAPGSRNTPTRP